MFEILSHEKHGSLLTIFIIGFLFGSIILYSRVDKFEKMAGFLLFEDTLAIRMAMTTVGLSSIGFYFLVANGYASYDVKPTIVGGLIVGSFMFGTGLVILGKCPSAFFVSVSEGRVDAFVGVLGGMVAGALFNYCYPAIKKIMGPDLGTMRVPDFFNDYTLEITVVFGVSMLIGAYLLPTLDYEDSADTKG